MMNTTTNQSLLLSPSSSEEGGGGGGGDHQGTKSTDHQYQLVEEERPHHHHHREVAVTPSLEGLEEEILGYKFKNQNLLQEAYIHASLYYPDKSAGLSYERLEFIGDSVLNLLMTKELFSTYPHLLPGPLTKLRAANVDNEKLARVAIKLGLHRFLSHKNHHLVDQIRDFTEAINEYPMHSNGLIDPPKFLADIVESTIGAIYEDSNYSLDTVWKVIKELLEPIITPETMGKHPVPELHEFGHKNGITVKFVPGTGKQQENYTSVEVLVDGVSEGSFTYKIGSLKKEIAQNRLAKRVLDEFKQKLSLATDDDDDTD